MSADDRLAILEAIAWYSHTLDNGDDEGWVQLFTPDAVWEAVPQGATEASIRYEGHDGIRRFAGEMRSRGAGSQSRHLRMNTIFTELTADRARTRSNGLITVHVAGAEPRIGLTGIYDETWRRTEAGWLLAHVTLHIDRPTAPA
jgi:hypothetical protein